MPVLQILPHLGLSVFRFGMSRRVCRSLLGTSFTSFSRRGDGSQEIDAFDEYGVQLNFDADDHLEFVEAHEPLDVEYLGVLMLGRSLPDVVNDLRKVGVVGIEDDVGVDYPEHGFGLYASNGMVEGVSFYPKGYYG